MSLPPNVSDRRAHFEVRLVFPSACETLKPFFDPSNSWGGGAHPNHENLALRALKEEYPQLSAHESFIVISTVKRLYASGSYTPVP